MTRLESMSHDEAIELLPWLVNKSLDEGERDAVTAHATACVICRRELEELEVLHDSIQRSASAIEPPVADMRRINARIDEQLARDNRGARLLQSVREFFRSPLQIAFAAQSLALVIAVALLLQPQSSPPVFETLTTPQVLPSGHYVRVVFDPTIDEAELAELFEVFELSIADGPTERGVYTLQFAAETTEVDRERSVAALQDDQRVLFADTITGGN